jgi:hypothetical protein
MSTNTIQPANRLPASALSPFLKGPAVVLSYLFHPIFVPLYAVLFLVYVHPAYFSGFSGGNKLRTIFIVVQNAIFYPLFCIALLKGLGFIQSVFLRTQTDRIIPYIACGIFFFWVFLVFYRQPEYPRVLPSFLLGVFLASSAALIANIYFKISMHAIGLGGWLGLFIIITQQNSMQMTWPLAAVVLITGLVSTARLMVTNHKSGDIYAGLLLGLAAQITAAYIILG